MLIADFLPIQTGGVLAGSAEYFNKWAWYWQGISIIEERLIGDIDIYR